MKIFNYKMNYRRNYIKSLHDSAIRNAEKKLQLKLLNQQMQKMSFKMVINTYNYNYIGCKNAGHVVITYWNVRIRQCMMNIFFYKSRLKKWLQITRQQVLSQLKSIKLNYSWMIIDVIKVIMTEIFRFQHHEYIGAR